MTFDELVADGGKPVEPSKGMTLEQLLADGAKPVEAKPAADELPDLGSAKAAMPLPSDKVSTGRAGALGAAGLLGMGVAPLAAAGIRSLPLVGNGHPYKENLADIASERDDAKTQHPLATDVGAGVGLAASAVPAMAGAAIPAVGRALGAGAAPFVADGLFGKAAQGALYTGAPSFVQGAGEALSAGKPINEALKEGREASQVGMVVGGGLPVVGAGLTSIWKTIAGATKRQETRILGEVQMGATVKIRDQIDKKADAVVDLILDNDLRHLTGPEQSKELVEKTAAITRANTARTSTEYAAAGNVETPKLVDRVTKAINALSGFDQQEEKAALQKQAEKLFGQHSAELNGGTAISAKELRGEVTRLQQIAYDRSLTKQSTEAQAAAGELSKMFIDELHEHVKTTLGPEKAALIKKLDAETTAAIRIEAAAKMRTPTRMQNRLSRIMGGTAAKIVGGVVGGALGESLGGSHAAAAAGAAVGAQAGNIVSAVTETGAKLLTKADEGILIRIAKAAGGRQPIESLKDAAIKQGISPTMIARVIKLATK